MRTFIRVQKHEVSIWISCSRSAIRRKSELSSLVILLLITDFTGYIFLFCLWRISHLHCFGSDSEHSIRVLFIIIALAYINIIAVIGIHYLPYN